MRRKKVSYSSLSDTDLVEHCISGNEPACKELYDRYKNYCYSICVRYGVQDIDLKDMLQIIFSEIFRSLPNYNLDLSALKTWISRISITQILMKWRKKKIYYDSLEEENIIFLSECGYAGDRLDQQYILKVLSQMPAQYKTVFNLAIIDGYSHTEIAEKVGISESNSRILLYRGRRWAMEKLAFFFEEKTPLTKTL